MKRSEDATGLEPDAVPDRLIIKGPLTLEQVGRLLGVSRERVRQIEDKAMRKLLDGLRSIGVNAPGSLLEVHTDKLRDMGPKSFERLPIRKRNTAGPTAAARKVLKHAGLAGKHKLAMKDAEPGLNAAERDSSLTGQLCLFATDE